MREDGYQWERPQRHLTIELLFSGFAYKLCFWEPLLSETSPSRSFTSVCDKRYYVFCGTSHSKRTGGYVHYQWSGCMGNVIAKTDRVNKWKRICWIWRNRIYEILPNRTWMIKNYATGEWRAFGICGNLCSFELTSSGWPWKKKIQTDSPCKYKHRRFILS